MKIRTLTLSITIIPALLVASVLVVFTTSERFLDLQTSLKKDGQNYASMVASFSEFALTFGSPAYVETQLKRLMQHQEIVAVEILDASNTLFANRYKPGFAQSAHNDSLIFTANITGPVYKESIFDSGNLAEQQTLLTKQNSQLGSVRVYLSSSQISQQEQRLVATLIVLIMLSVILCAIFSIIASHFITVPLKNIIEAVSNIRADRFNTLPRNISNIMEFRNLEQDIIRLQAELNETKQRNESYVSELITARSNAEKLVSQRTSELKEARDNALIASKSKDAFLAMISHEFRTPLQSIMGYLKLLRSDIHIPTNTTNEDLDYLEIAATDLLNLTEGILDFKRIESGQIDLNYSTAYFPSFLRDTCGSILPLAKSSNIQISIEETDEINMLVTDFARLRQVLLNLLSNAIKHSGAKIVRIKAEILHKAKARLKVQIIDDGQGISNEQLSNIFKPFTQLRRQEDTAVRGVGLGLTISKQLVALMGGNIQVRSTLGIGCCFSIIIPLQQTNPIKKPVTSTIITDKCPSLRILLAEDDGIVSRLIKRILENLGHSVSLETDGRSALEHLMRAEFDLCIVDYNMPRLNGLEVAIRYRYNKGIPNAITPFILLTADGSQSTVDAINAADLPMLIKPVSETMLQSVILSTIKNARINPHRDNHQLTSPNEPPIIHMPCFNEIVSMGGKDFAVETYREFLQELSDLIRMLPNNNDDIALISTQLHRFRGSGCTLGLYQLTQVLNMDTFQQFGSSNYINTLNINLQLIENTINQVSRTFVDRNMATRRVS